MNDEDYKDCEPRESCLLAVTLGRRLHRWRMAHNLPLKALAFDLDVSISTIDTWEQGLRFPSGRHLEALSKYTNIPICGLLWMGEKDCNFFTNNEECRAVAEKG